MTVATDQLLSAEKGAELIRAKTGRKCSRQNLDKLCKQGKLPRSTASTAPVRVRAALLVDEYLANIDQRQAVRDKPGVKAELALPAAKRSPQASADEPLTDDELPAYTVSQQRKAYEQANLLEIERRQKEGQLVERESVLSTWAQLINSAKTKLLGVRTACRQRIPHLTAEEAEIIDALIRDAMEGLAEDAGCPAQVQP
jgi:hypothetical protein